MLATPSGLISALSTRMCASLQVASGPAVSRSNRRGCQGSYSGERVEMLSASSAQAKGIICGFQNLLCLFLARQLHGQNAQHDDDNTQNILFSERLAQQ